MKHAAICIATYKRQDGLIRLLEALKEQTLPHGWSSEVRVVNNDPEANHGTFTAMLLSVDPDARISFEPRRNIAHARNTALAMGRADAFVFIDDDEIPTAGWLECLLKRLHDADAVFGPVVGRVVQDTPGWLVRSGAFDKPGPNHDGPIDWRGTRTSSTAVRGEWIGRGTRFFDPEYGTSGGSDTEFFRRIESQGARFVHERGALVYEDSEPERCRWKAVVLRRFRAGAVYGRMEQDIGNLARWWRLVTRTGAASARLVAALPVALAARPEHAFNALCRFAIAYGAWRGHDSSYRVTRYPAKSPTGSPKSTATGGLPCVSPC